MPTEPFKAILDPEFSKVGAREIIELASPLLRELVNHATYALRRCDAVTNVDRGLDEDFAPFVLYRQIIEMTDGVEELVRQCCGRACIPLVRASFEAVLGLDYILRADFSRRSLSWCYVFWWHRLRTYRQFDRATREGAEFTGAWQEQFRQQFPEPPRLREGIENLEKLLLKPHLAAIATEFERSRQACRREKRRPPAWYSLFDGPSDLSRLATHVGYRTEYLLLYRQWSSIVHATDGSDTLSSRKDGSPAFKCLRYPGEIRTVALAASTFLIRATRMMIDRYRHGESLKPWYLQEVRPKLLALGGTVFKIEAIEV